jgi:hypothetical protein
VRINGTLVEDKMRRFKGECEHFRFNKCPIYTHDGASAKFSTNSQEMDNSEGSRSELEFLKKSMGARHRGGIGFSYRPARLHRLAEFIPWNQCRGPIKYGLCVCLTVELVSSANSNSQSLSVFLNWEV